MRFNSASFIQPFNLSYNHYDLHVMLYFDGHPEYEAIEAMIRFQNPNNPVILAIITRHDQTQMDYINDPELFEKLRSTYPDARKMYHVPIEFVKKDSNLILKFTSNKGEKVVFNINTVGKATTAHGGLIDPEGHAKESVLPVMWSAKNTLASTKSNISIDGKNYQVPVKIKVPLFFTGLKGYYTEGFSIGVINTGKTTLEIITTPEKIETNREWLVKNGPMESVYQIYKFDGRNLTIRAKDKTEQINAILVNNQIRFKSIEVSASPESKEKMALHFSPELPEPSAMSDRGKEAVEFRIDVDEHEKVIHGQIEIKKEGGQVFIRVMPVKPKWAVNRGFQVILDKDGNDLFQIHSSIIS